jgi:ribosomal protein S1
MACLTNCGPHKRLPGKSNDISMSLQSSELTAIKPQGIMLRQSYLRESCIVSVESPISLAEVSPGQKLEGTVRKVMLSGAVLDVGAQVDGLLHISELGNKKVTRTSDVLAEGQSVTVWVKKVDLANSRLDLTMIEPPKYTWKDLEPGRQLEGRVVRVEKFGVFVDIGAETDGLVHISEMSSGRVVRPSDIASVGDQVQVWIKDVDRKSRRISLTMNEPPEVDIRTLKPDTVLVGKVIRIESFGAFVDIGAGRDGMIHVSEMGRGYVGNPAEILSVGDEVQVKVLEVDSRRGRIALSMKDLPTEQLQIDEEIEEMPSSMELALRAALEQGDMPFLPKQTERQRRRREKRHSDRTQDEIIARTLSAHHG